MRSVARLAFAGVLAGLLASAPAMAQTGVILHHILDAWRYLLLSQALPQAPTGEIQFGNSGYTDYGQWYTTVSASPASWRPGTVVKVNARLLISEEHLAALAALKIVPDGFCLLVTSERTFDAEGRFRQVLDERMGTLLTPTGLAIEGGVQGAATTRFGYYGFRTPLDQFVVRPLSAVTQLAGQREIEFSVQGELPTDLPPGIYRLRLDYGVRVRTTYYNLNGESFARRAFPKGRATESFVYSPPVRASGMHVSGRIVNAATIKPRIYWVLLNNYTSNGYRGVVAEEDQPHFAIAGRNLIQDDVILPLYSDPSNTRTKVSYSLEPQFLTDTIEARANIPWDYTKGELSIQVTGPDGITRDLGTAPFIGQSGQWPTTRRSALTAWQPPAYGEYTVKATGWVSDIWGNRYEGGGTYRFWIANRVTLATATFQGMAYPVGNRYGRDIGFAPAVPADVEVNAMLYVNSDPNNARRLSFTGKASPSGMFTSAQGNKALTFDAPGEYLGHVVARYTDKDGHLWMCSMRHAGVVYPEDSPIVARGKKLTISNKYVDRGETQREGWVDTTTGISYLEHINFPYSSSDVLLIASEQQGANKIEPVLIWESKQTPAPYEARFQSIGVTNVQLRTSNGYAPHMFPEYIIDWAYYYGAAPRPGFMSRFVVGEDGVRAPYWPTSPNSFGGQINASNNGDLPGDIYRLIGGVVLRREEEPPLYAGYLASAFILPKGSKNNRVIAPGSEDVTGPNGRKARFFLVGTRPGLMYETGTAFAPAIQIDPILPVNITFTLQYPDGRTMVARGQGDRFGSFAGTDRWTLDVPGAYRFFLEAEWQGYKGYMPGLPPQGGEFYVVEKDRPADAPRLRLNLPVQSTFTPTAGLTITGTSTAQEVRYAAVIPGAVIAQGTLAVNGGKFQYFFDPAAINKETPTYDTIYLPTGRSEIKDVVHLTFSSKEVAPDGKTYHSFTRVILRGNQVIYVKD